MTSGKCGWEVCGGGDCLVMCGVGSVWWCVVEGG